ncbi:DUF2958 domain-containing protein [Parvularcula sp. ZS-1/3]|uniref:DUF2958 domain-containing protein n=1 Tax=Parvularcula mediterranea TaxID=2732508 RepID=A0A7Y3RQJ5_9PROT|nr:DUF2958 domain-containing protein [Parvularcula mediterranea]NNU17532.1 DUF2958 domain-containing protein [Parvularcula mediterranea]
MKLLTSDHRTALKAAFEDETKDHPPLVKLFRPWGPGTWLLMGLTEDEALAFGLCDLGLGFPELGYVSLDELRAVKGPFGLGVERDIHFTAKATIGVYAEAARIGEAITEDEGKLRQACAVLERRAKEDGRRLRATML